MRRLPPSAAFAAAAAATVLPTAAAAALPALRAWSVATVRHFAAPASASSSGGGGGGASPGTLSGTAKAKLEKEKRARRRRSKNLTFKVRRRRRTALVGGGGADARALALPPCLQAQSGPVYHVEEALRLVRAHATARFDETVDLQVQLAVDPRKPNQNIRGVAQLPCGSGKAVNVAVFARGEKAEEARRAGATVVGAEDLVERIAGGDVPFTKIIATPDVMPLVGRVARVRFTRSARRTAAARAATALPTGRAHADPGPAGPHAQPQAGDGDDGGARSGGGGETRASRVPRREARNCDGRCGEGVLPRRRPAG